MIPIRVDKVEEIISDFNQQLGVKFHSDWQDRLTGTTQKIADARYRSQLGI